MRKKSEGKSIKEKKFKIKWKRMRKLGNFLSLRNMDYILFSNVLFLVILGVGMVFSASYYWAMARNGSINFYFTRMIIYAIMAIIAMIVVSRIDYHKIVSMSKALFVLGILLLSIVQFTPLAKTVNGAKRWINLSFFTFQPSEIVKFITIIVIASIIAKHKNSNNIEAIVKVVIVAGIYCSFIMLQPNMSTVITIGVTVVVMVFVSGLDIKWFITMAVLGSIGAVYFALSASYRMSRVMSFLDPFHDPGGESFQVVQSLLAIGAGGFFGKGPGHSVQKNLYLPEPHTDFIMAIIGEELGFIGLVVLIVAFVFLVYRGLRIAIQAPDIAGTLIATGVVVLIGFQVVANIAIVTSSMPATGIGLPFISYGGTSIVFFCAGMGMVLNISRQANLNEKKIMKNERREMWIKQR